MEWSGERCVRTPGRPFKVTCAFSIVALLNVLPAFDPNREGLCVVVDRNLANR